MHNADLFVRSAFKVERVIASERKTLMEVLGLEPGWSRPFLQEENLSQGAFTNRFLGGYTTPLSPGLEGGLFSLYAL